MLTYCKTSREIIELFDREGRDPVCFMVEGDFGNTCSEPEDCFMELSECEVKVILPGILNVNGGKNG